MACTIRTNRHGFLAYRLYFAGIESHEGTRLRDTPKHREKLEARARVMSDEMKAGTFEYLHWFPKGNRAHVFRPAPAAVPHTIPTVAEYADRTWLPRKVPPLVRATLAKTYRSALQHVRRRLGDVRLDQVTPAALEDFRAYLTGPEHQGGRGLKMKTARDIIDAHFRALYRDARTVDRLVRDDPFAALKWPQKVDPEPDPFTEAERDVLLEHFRQKNGHYFPLVHTMFFTGLRTGEAVGLRWGDVDLRAGKLIVHRSRTMGEDNAPKTKRSRRTLTLLPDVARVLREARPLHLAEGGFVFATPTRTSLDEKGFVAKDWYRALRATGVRPRKFYATRHTFISSALTRGANLKWLADYCGTSVDMIERHYGRYMHGDEGQLALLVDRRPEPHRARVGADPEQALPGPRRGPQPGTFPGTFRVTAEKARQDKEGGARVNLHRVPAQRARRSA